MLSKNTTKIIEKTIILLIISLITYWTGNKKVKFQAAATEYWPPEEIEAVPLQVWELADGEEPV